MLSISSLISLGTEQIFLSILGTGTTSRFPSYRRVLLSPSERPVEGGERHRADRVVAIVDRMYLLEEIGQERDGGDAADHYGCHIVIGREGDAAQGLCQRVLLPGDGGEGVVVVSERFRPTRLPLQEHGLCLEGSESVVVGEDAEGTPRSLTCHASNAARLPHFE